MHDTVTASFREGLRDLVHDLGDGAPRRRAPLDPAPQAPSLDVLERHPRRLAVQSMVEECHDAGMDDAGREPGLVVEAPPLLLGAAVLRVQQLHRDHAVQGALARLPDGAEPAAGDETHGLEAVGEAVRKLDDAQR